MKMMPIFSHYKTMTLAALLLFMRAATAQEVDSSWRLRLMGMAHQPKAEATLHFTGKPVRSCMRGKWKRLEVGSIEGTEPGFFPLDAPVAYKLDHGVLTMGRTAVCNRYVLLSATSAERDIHGTFSTVSVGRSRKLGLFSLDPIPAVIPEPKRAIPH
jgi:hypothetical protein